MVISPKLVGHAKRSRLKIEKERNEIKRKETCQETKQREEKREKGKERNETKRKEKKGTQSWVCLRCFVRWTRGERKRQYFTPKTT